MFERLALLWNKQSREHSLLAEYFQANKNNIKLPVQMHQAKISSYFLNVAFLATSRRVTVWKGSLQEQKSQLAGPGVAKNFIEFETLNHF